MSRLPELGRDQLPAEAQIIWDAIVETRGDVHGPYSILMHVPNLAEKVATLGDYFRSQSQLSGTDRELAILALARESGSRYEWSRHDPIAREEGVRPEAIDAIRQTHFEKLTARERLITEVVQSLYRTRTLPDELYDRAAQEMGVDVLIELVALAGFHALVAFILRSFKVKTSEPGQTPF